VAASAQMDSFDEEDPSFEGIQQKIENLRLTWRKYGFGPILWACAQRAQDEQKTTDGLEYLRQLPFVNQRLAQWVLADQDCPEKGRSVLTRSAFEMLFQATHEIVHGFAPTFLVKSRGVGALRAIAFQQFEFQTAPRFDLLRQFFITNQLPPNHRLLSQSIFPNNLSGMDLILGSHLLGVHAINSPGQPLTALGLLARNPWFPKEKLNAIFEILGANQAQLRMRFSADGKKSISVLSAMHRPAFRSKPLFEISKRKYVMWSPKLLLRSLGDVFIQSIRDADDKNLIAEFGRVFETKYVSTAVKSLCHNFVSEADLKKFLQPNERVVDFLLNFGQTIILVESKIKDADEATQSAFEDVQIGDRFKTSIIKAIDQGQSTAKLIRSGRFDGLGINSDPNIFLLIVTTDQHYLGTGVDVAERTGKERIARLVADYGGILPVPLEQIVLLTADGLDFLTTLSQQGETSILKFVEEMRDRELTADPSRRVMVGEQILKISDPYALPSFLQDAENIWMERAMTAYGGTGGRRVTLAFRNYYGRSPFVSNWPFA